MNLKKYRRKDYWQKLFLCRYVISCFALLCCKSQHSLQQIHQSGWQIDTLYDQWSYLALQQEDLPGQIFCFTAPETFTASAPDDRGRGLIKINHQPWVFQRDGAFMTSTDSNYTYSIQVKPGSTKKTKYIDWVIEFTNHRSDTVRDLAAFNCVDLSRASQFKDTALQRTWVTDQQGHPVLLDQVRRSRGIDTRNMQFYPAVSGIKNLSLSRWISHWRVISPDTLSGNTITVVSVKGDWKISNSVDGKVAYFFANSETTHGCIHASPLIAEQLLPGQTGRASGRILLSKVSYIPSSPTKMNE